MTVVFFPEAHSHKAQPNRRDNGNGEKQKHQHFPAMLPHMLLSQNQGVADFDARNARVRRVLMMMRMARKHTRRSTSKTTEWSLGQPLAFPTKINRSNFERLAREAVDEVKSGPSKRRRSKRKKK
jgi:hypothetical protein